MFEFTVSGDILQDCGMHLFSMDLSNWEGGDVDKQCNMHLLCHEEIARLRQSAKGFKFDADQTELTAHRESAVGKAQPQKRTRLPRDKHFFQYKFANSIRTKSTIMVLDP